METAISVAIVIAVLLVYLTVGTVICAALKCIFEFEFSGYGDSPPLGLAITFWPITVFITFILLIVTIIFSFNEDTINPYSLLFNYLVKKCEATKQWFKTKTQED